MKIYLYICRIKFIVMGLKYQEKIFEALKNGSKLQCTEGSNYKTWLIHPNGKTETVRRDSANKVCETYANKLVFGEHGGIRIIDRYLTSKQ